MPIDEEELSPDTIARSWQQRAEKAEAELTARDRELENERGRRRMAEQRVSGEVWYWQGDGEDHLESLTCPVIISAEAMRAGDQELAEARGVRRQEINWKKRAEVAEAELATTEAELSSRDRELEQTKEGFRQGLTAWSRQIDLLKEKVTALEQRIRESHTIEEWAKMQDAAK